MAAQHAITILPLEKTPTGIAGFDEITGGGLPYSKTTLLVGGPGSGKTVFALNTLVNGARMYAEPGIFVAFEESSQQIVQNAESFGWDLPGLIDQKLFFLDAQLSMDAILSGGFDLIGLLTSLKSKAEEMSTANNGARVRVVFDAADVMLTHLQDDYAARLEMERIHEWLHSNIITGIVTAKTPADGDHRSGAYDYLHYLADCVVELRREVIDRVSHRTLNIIKYRGSRFAENEVDVVIGPGGISVPSLGLFNLDYAASKERISTGIEQLDDMFGGGYLRGTSILLTGLPGTSKSTIAAIYVEAACKRGERALYISFDEGPGELVRNFSSVSVQLAPHLESGLLQLYATRAEAKSAVEHLVDIKTLIAVHQPRVVVIDPVSSLVKAGGQRLATMVSQRLIYECKANGITLLMTSLLDNNLPELEATPLEVSTIADTWIHLSYVMLSGERNRALTVVKSRGTGHSNQVRELLISDTGIKMSDVYIAGGEVLMGTLRFEREAEERRSAKLRRYETESRLRTLDIQRAELSARLENLRREMEAREADMARLSEEVTSDEQQRQADQASVYQRRMGASSREEGEE
jgi:circadian clock protein KaiC